MKKLFTFLFILCIFNSIKSQEGSTQDWSKEDQKIFESATELFNKHYYDAAYEKYVSLQPKHADDLFLKFVRGVCAVYINNKHKEAEKLLMEVKKNSPAAENIDYYLALLYHKSYRFDKALELTNGLLSNKNLTKEDRSDLERIAFFSKNGKNEIQYPLECFIENLGTPLNGEYAEYGPVITPDEESIIYTYRGKLSTGGLVDDNNKPDPNGDYHEDIMISKKINGLWQKPTQLGGLNAAGNDAVIALSPDANELFVFKTEGNGDIFVCKREGDSYSQPEKLKGGVNSTEWEGSLSISTDQKKLFFASARPGGFGGKDLYVATKQADGNWGNVKNLGNKINTQYDEDAPFISPDSRILIFSSEGHNSIGDFDLFISDWNKSDSIWQAPKNLGYPINTTDDDLFYVLSPDGKRGYFSSARDGGKGDQDLYVVEPGLSSKKTFITLVRGKVTEKDLPLGCEIEVSILGEAKNYGVYKSNALSGNYILNLPLGSKYKIVFKHKTSGERVYEVNTIDVDDYAEKTIDVNFSNSQITAVNKINFIAVTNKDTVSIVHKPAALIAANKVINEEPVKNVKAEIEKTEPIAINNKSESPAVKKDKPEIKEEKNVEKIEKAEVLKTETTVAKTKTKKEKPVFSNESPEKGVVSNSAKTENKTSDGLLSCDDIKTDHDADFDYKLCNNVWYTKSKENPFSDYARDKAKTWVSLFNNDLANDRLNKKYPK